MRHGFYGIIHAAHICAAADIQCLCVRSTLDHRIYSIHRVVRYIQYFLCIRAVVFKMACKTLFIHVTSISGEQFILPLSDDFHVEPAANNEYRVTGGSIAFDISSKEYFVMLSRLKTAGVLV